MTMATMQLEIITAERVVSSEDVSIVVAPGIDGELGILPHHAPLFTALQPGELRVVKDGEESFIAVSGGFLEVLGDTVTVLADTSERLEEIDLDRAQEARDRALEAIDTIMTPSEMMEARIRLMRALARIRAARRRRR